MALHATRKNVNFKLSLKKQIIDNAGSLKVLFDFINDIPKTSTVQDTEWVVVQFGDRLGEDLVQQEVFFHLFTHKDIEGDDLAALQDKVMTLFTNTDGSLGPMTLYNTYTTVWTAIGGVSIFEFNDSTELEDENGIKFKTITLLFKWNAV